MEIPDNQNGPDTPVLEATLSEIKSPGKSEAPHRLTLIESLGPAGRQATVNRDPLVGQVIINTKGGPNMGQATDNAKESPKMGQATDNAKEGPKMGQATANAKEGPKMGQATANAKGGPTVGQASVDTTTTGSPTVSTKDKKQKKNKEKKTMTTAYGVMDVTPKKQKPNLGSAKTAVDIAKKPTPQLNKGQTQKKETVKEDKISTKFTEIEMKYSPEPMEKDDKDHKEIIDNKHVSDNDSNGMRESGVQTVQGEIEASGVCTMKENDKHLAIICHPRKCSVVHLIDKRTLKVTQVGAHNEINIKTHKGAKQEQLQNENAENIDSPPSSQEAEYVEANGLCQTQENDTHLAIICHPRNCTMVHLINKEALLTANVEEMNASDGEISEKFEDNFDMKSDEGFEPKEVCTMEETDSRLAIICPPRDYTVVHLIEKKDLKWPVNK